MSALSRYNLSLRAAALLSAAAFAHTHSDAVAAEAELPPVVVEGTSIEARPIVKPQAKAKPQPVAEDEGETAPPVKAKAKPAKANAATAKATSKSASEGGGNGTQAASGEASAVAGDAEAGAGSEMAGASNVGVATETYGTSVSVVTASDLKARQVHNAADALRDLPGVAVSRTGGFNGLTQVRLRGGEGNHTLVLIDGVEANDTFNGEFDFSHLSADDIDRIEVIRGPQSGLYGSGAVGGVVNIVTRGGRGPLTFRAMGEGGSFGTRAGSIGVSGGNDRVWGSVSLSDRKTDGFNIAPVGNEDDGSELKSFNIRAGAQILPGVAIDLSLRHTRKLGDRDQQDPFPSITGVQVDDPATFDESTWIGGAKLTWESFDGHFVQAFKATRNVTDRADHSLYFGVTSDTINSGERENYSYTATYRLDTPELLGAHHYLTAYTEHENEAFTPRSDFGFGFAADGIERKRTLDAVAGEYRGELADTLFLQGTVRHDDSDVFGGFDTWRTSASLVLHGTGLRPHASYGTGVKLPTMFENFGSIPGAYYANPDLQPEHSKGWDAGLEWTLARGFAVVDVTYFDSVLTNKIHNFANCRNAPAPFFSECTAVNLPGESTSKGVEVASRFDLGAGLTLGLAYTFTDARDPDGVPEIRRPRHTGRGDLTYAFDGDRGLLSVSAEYTGANPDSNFGPYPPLRVSLDPYWLVNVAASYKIAPGTELFGRVENLLDSDYQEIYGFATAGIGAYAGVRFTYEEPSTRDWVKYK